MENTNKIITKIKKTKGKEINSKKMVTVSKYLHSG